MVNAVLRGRFLNTLPYSLALLGMVTIALALFYLVSSSGQAAQTPIVASPQSRTATDRRIESLQERLADQPANQAAYVQLGSEYLQKARETGDTSYYARAEDALTKALGLVPDDASAMSLIGAVALARHEFQDALAWAERSLALNPSITNTYGVLGDAQIELGQYEAAVESFQTMVDLKPNLSSYARVSHARKLMGDVDGAIEVMQMAVSSGSPGTEGAAWASVQLGDLYFNTGRIDKAANQYETALKSYSGYYLSLAALGKARAAQGRYDEAIRLYERAVAIIPQPTTLAALGDLYARTGEDAKAQVQYDTVEFIARLAAINQQVYNRDLAMFYADHDIELEEALELASTELMVRKDIYGYDTLAWTLYKNGRLSEAAEAIAEAMKLGTRDANLYYHAGMIYYGLGDEKQAHEYLGQALGLNPQFSLIHAPLARRTLEEIRVRLASSGQSRLLED